MSDLGLYPVERILEENGSLTVFEQGGVPFEVKRVFVVEAPVGQTRGQHAHRTCQQFLWVITGRVSVEVDAGRAEFRYELEPNGDGLLIPPLMWARQTYLLPLTRLLVACDQRFSEDDYIRDHQTFLNLIE